jgi:type I restriction enzyme S subunit
MSWPTVKLGDVCQFVRGPFGGALKKEFFTEDGYAVYEQQHAIYDQFENIRYFVDENKFNEMKRFELREGDLIMSCSGTMGKVAIVPAEIKKGIINQALLKLTPNKVLDLKFLKLYMESGLFQLQLNENTHGAAIKNVASVSILKDIEIPLPPLAEQKRIAAILDKADEIRRKREQTIAKLDQLAQSIFVEMFGNPTDKKRWPTYSMQQLCQKITDGTHHSPAIKNDGIPYITAKHLKADGLDFFSKPWFISKQDHDQIYKRCDPKKDDVLYIKDGATTGIAAVNNYEFEFSMLSSLALLRVNKTLLNAQYICYWLNNPVVKRNLLGFMAGAAIQRLTLAKIQKIIVPTPPLKQQEQFATRIKNLEQLKANHIAALTQQTQLFASLQHQAFTGNL